MLDFEDLLVKAKHLPYWLFEAKKNPSGYLKREYDQRDFKFGSLFGFGAYQPKHSVWVIPTLSVKNQGQYNTCSWNANTVAKEVLEQKVLSVRSLIAEGVKEGLVSGNGFANIDSAAKVLKNWGILDKGVIDEMEGTNNWPTYSSVDTSQYNNQASPNKDLSYYFLDNRNDFWKCLDDGNVFTTAIDWYTGFNQGGGFSFPFLIQKYLGWEVGGHCFVCVGYDMNFYSYSRNNADIERKVLIFQNSYGDGWGDTRLFKLDDGREIIMKGLFYVDLAWFEKNNYDSVALIDLPQEKKNNLTNMLKKFKRDVHGGLWFVKDNKKQKIDDVLSLTGALVDEFGVDAPLTDDQLNNIPDYPFFGKK